EGQTYWGTAAASGAWKECQQLLCRGLKAEQTEECKASAVCGPLRFVDSRQEPHRSGQEPGVTRNKGLVAKGSSPSSRSQSGLCAPSVEGVKNFSDRFSMHKVGTETVPHPQLAHQMPGHWLGRTNPSISSKVESFSVETPSANTM
ncbi:unnamed protein product, partial [Choristocarpus tenellus]